MNQVIRRLERVEGDLLAERNARVDDLALLVDLVSSGWKGVDTRLARLEAVIEQAGAGHAGEERRHRLPDGRPPSGRRQLLTLSRSPRG